MSWQGNAPFARLKNGQLTVYMDSRGITTASPAHHLDQLDAHGQEAADYVAQLPKPGAPTEAFHAAFERNGWKITEQSANGRLVTLEV